MKKILFTLTKSTYSTTEASLLLQRAKPGDGLLLAQDAVFGLTHPNGEFASFIRNKKAEGIQIYVSAPDCQARGVKPIAEFPLVSYADQVDLICEYDLFC